MSKMNDAQRDAVLRAAKDAGAYHVKAMEDELGELRSFLEKEGGMKVTYPDKAEFIKVAQQVQDEFAADRSEEFKKITPGYSRRSKIKKMTPTYQKSWGHFLKKKFITI